MLVSSGVCAELVEVAEEAGFGIGVTGGSGRVDQEEECIGVAVDADVDYPLRVARGRAFSPVFLPAAAPKDGFAKLQGTLQRAGVHVCHHQHFMGLRVLDNCGNQAVFVPVYFGERIGIRHHPDSPSR